MEKTTQPIIAQAPASPRDSSRLLVYKTATGEVFFDRFYNIHRYLPENSFLVLNKTRVVPARVEARKETGGKVELLLLVNELQPGDTMIKGLADRKILVGQILSLGYNYTLKVFAQDGKIFFFQPNFSIKKLQKILQRMGKTPLPPYIAKTPLRESELRKKYQTVFAQQAGSVAAPTAALHFTDRVFQKLAHRGIPHEFVTLHVGLGTFSSVTEENVVKKKLFEEWYEIDEKAAQHIQQWRRAGRPLVAVGTTTVRTLESWTSAPPRRHGSTSLFILPPYDFCLIDALITNFHLPGSSLIMLVEAFLQFKGARKSLHDLYALAAAEKIRFYSFGDAMLIL